jgi:hypothetical protein
MSNARAGTPGATRVCPHCKAIVLETATVCPGCRHHLRFSSSDALAPAEGYCAFNIEGTIAHKHSGEHCEYCIVLDIRNERGEQVIRQVVGVGALHPGELRRLSLAVEMLPVRAAAPKGDSASARDERKGAASATPARAPVAAARPAAAATAPSAPAALGASIAGATSRAPAPAAVPPPAPSRTAAAAAVTAVGATPHTPNPVTGRPATAPRGGETGSGGTQGNTDPSPLSPSPSGQPLRIFRKP